MFFDLMPSEKLPTVSLDLRAYASREEDKGFQAKVFARQEGTVPRWKDVGTVASLNSELLSQAVAKQRPLIARWAYLVCNDFTTGNLLMQVDGPTIELSWATQPPKPGPFDALFGKEIKLELNEVPTGQPFDESMCCGFLGKPGREVKGGGALPRFERIEFPETSPEGSAFE